MDRFDLFVIGTGPAGQRAAVQAAKLGKRVGIGERREVVVRAGKGETTRVVPLTRMAYGRLLDYLERGRPALVARHAQPTEGLLVTPRGRLTVDSLADLLERATATAGIKKHVTPHTLRRTFATTLLKNGVNVRHIQALLGHSNL
jgi:integrase/recombinase XerD